MTFTACEAYEAREDGDPIVLSRTRAVALLRAHHAEDIDEILRDTEGAAGEWDAWSLLAALGY